jgi:hypothetical protein
MVKAQENSLKINEALTNTLNDLLEFPLMEAIAGRRARRFCMGAEIPDGVLAFKSKHKPMPLSEIEQLLVLSYMGGVTGWHFAIMHHERMLPNFLTIVLVLLVALFLQQLALLHQNYSLLMIMVHTFFLHVTFIQK